MRLDRRGAVALAAGLDHVGVERALDQEPRALELAGLVLEDADELVADDLALASRARSTPARRSRNRSSASTWTSFTPELVAERVYDLLGLVLAHQAVVHEDARELVADRAVDQRRGGRRVDAAGEAADHLRVAHLGADPLDLLLDHRRRRPDLLAARDLPQEALEDLRAVGGVDDLGVELDPVEAALDRLERCDRRPWAGRQRLEAGRRLEHAVAMAHPCLLLLREPGEEPTARRRSA